MTSHVGIWVDHAQAVIVSGSGEHVTTVANAEGGHPRYSGQLDAAGGEKRYEQRHAQALDQYYDEVIARIPAADSLLILGPGEAKSELKARLLRSKPNAHRAIDLETTDKMTEPQIAARVEQHFLT